MRGTGTRACPCNHEDIDCIVGIVHYKDLVEPLMDGKGDDPVAPYAYEAMFVPTKPRTCTRCLRRCKRIGNKWPSWLTNTAEPMV